MTEKPIAPAPAKPKERRLVWVEQYNGRPPMPCPYAWGGRFAAESLREKPAINIVEQKPMHGDDRRLSETTGRFGLRIGGHVVDPDVDMKPLLSAFKAFDIFDPTIRDLRLMLAGSWRAQGQVALVQRPKRDPREPKTIVTAPRMQPRDD